MDEVASEDDKEAPQPPIQPEVLSRFLPNAASVPGLQHIIDNILHDAHTRLPWWTEFFPRVKVPGHGQLNPGPSKAKVD